MRIERILSFSARLLLWTAIAQAEMVDLSGKVFTPSGEPAFGVGVRLLAGGMRTSSRPDGTWQLTGVLPDSSLPLVDTLVFSKEDEEFDRIAVPARIQSMLVAVAGDPAEATESARSFSCADRPSKPTSEQGQYARQSISHLDHVLLRGDAIRLRADQVGHVLEMLKGLRLPRFDVNPIPSALVGSYLAAIQRFGSPSNEQIGALLDRTLLPSIQQAVKDNQIARAAALQSDHQKNSMVSTKTKTLDITADQALSVLNAAWIYVPAVDGVSTSVINGIETSTVSMSLLWYHIQCDSSDGMMHAKLDRVVTGTGFMTAQQGTINTFQSAVKSCVRDLLTSTKDMEAFNLSGQVLHAGKFAATLDAGDNQGVSRNDVYALVENVQSKNDSTSRKDVGWVRVYSKSDSTSKARTVSGKPYAGLALREIPLSKWSLEFGLWREPVRIDKSACVEQVSYYYPYNSYYSCSHDEKVSHTSVVGPLVDAYYSPSWWYGLSMGVGFNLLFGDGLPADLKLSIRQSIPVYRRVSIYAEPEVALRFLLSADAISSTDASGKTSSMPPPTLQFGTFYGIELAMAPNCNLRLGLGNSELAETSYYMGSSGSKSQHKAYSDGPIFAFKIQWTPKAMPVDPFDLMLGQSWKLK